MRMKTLTFELVDEVYDVLQQMAKETGTPFEVLALEWLAKYAPRPGPRLSEEEIAAAEAELLKYAGAGSVGYPTGADNESIDADLAHEYGSTHEEEAS
jgi:hypothetical protein